MRRIDLLPLAEVEGALTNPKAHSDEEIEASVGRFGFVEPLLLDERTGRLIGGHGRLDALRALQGASEAIPPEGIEVDPDGAWRVPVVRGWSSSSDAEAEAALVALNRLSESGGWDRDALLALLKSVDASGSFEGTGFDHSALDDLLKSVEEEIAYRRDGDDSGEGAGEVPSMADRLVNYRTRGLRSLVLDYPLAEYEDVVARAARARNVLDLPSNAEVFAHLVDRWAT